ncbi:hypothetical protein [Aquisalibacillus elongatus]|uniref:Uncharacterized protein n=1 Tax=Aquisalibacillus elongatus TaxID=485577 RepID=A0A3N5B425_9BACI|nr:hypothetical protein [Aquisalibacillus elongatus]RPF52154.1 hypothetical protein EDC24_2144 [Aquisalibacillus elongatus]
MSDLLMQLNEKLQQLDQENQKFINRIQESLNQFPRTPISYFSYSLNVSNALDENNIIIANYTLFNITTHEIHQPFICLKLPEDPFFHMTGKIISPDMKRKGQPGAWERFTQSDRSQDYWLKPVDKDVLFPGEKLSFSNFQLTYAAEQNYNANVQGFFYGEGYHEGVPAINSISISGKVRGDSVES